MDTAQREKENKRRGGKSLCAKQIDTAGGGVASEQCPRARFHRNIFYKKKMKREQGKINCGVTATATATATARTESPDTTPPLKNCKLEVPSSSSASL